jgi:hypothetical protein
MSASRDTSFTMSTLIMLGRSSESVTIIICVTYAVKSARKWHILGLP